MPKRMFAQMFIGDYISNNNQKIPNSKCFAWGQKTRTVTLGDENRTGPRGVKILKRGLGLEISKLASFSVLGFSVEIIFENRNGNRKAGFVEA